MYVDMYLRVWYRNSSSKIILYVISVVDDYKSSNNFPKEIMSHYPNTSYYRLMKVEFGTHALHLSLKNLQSVIYVIHIHIFAE